MRPARVAAMLAAVALLLPACSGSAGGGSTPVPPGPDHSALVAAADLDPCPTSAATSSSSDLPDLTLPCLGAGPGVHLSGLTGRPLVLNVWGSWCLPCQKESPVLASVYQRVKDRVRFLGVDDEDIDDSALDFVAHVRPRLRYPSVTDADKAFLLAISGPVVVPTTFFVDADGHIVKQVIKSYDDDRELLADIESYLGVRG